MSPLLNGIKLTKALCIQGFIRNRIKGSCHILIHPEIHITLAIPVYKGRTFGKGITIAIIKDVGTDGRRVFKASLKRDHSGRPRPHLQQF